MNIPRPPDRYDAAWAGGLKRELEIESGLTHKRDQDVIIGAGRLILRSPNGSSWEIKVSNAGVISATAL